MSHRRPLSSMLLARAFQVAASSLVFGIVAALALASLRAAPFEQERDVFPALLGEALRICLPLALVAVVLWTGLFAIARSRLSPRASARLATLLALAPPLLLVLKVANHQLLPGLFEPESLIWNAVLLLASAGLLLLAATALRRWQEGAWTTGAWRAATACVLVLVPLAVYLSGATRARDPAPDVLVILLDVLRADHLGCYGYERATSPNLDALAEDGIVFENFISASTYTKTSVASLFTGLAAFHHGVYTGSQGGGTGEIESDLLSDKFVTLAEALYEHGFNTSAWVQNGHVRDYLGYAQGFTFYADQPGNVEVIARGFKRWKDRWADAARFFSYLHILDIHGPYDPPVPFLGRFGEVLRPELGPGLAKNSNLWIEFKQAVRRGDRVLSQDELDELEMRYDELIAYVDHYVGQVVEDLKATGRYDNTLIVVLSDHGEGFWEHAFISHSTVPFEELNHVPLIVKMPKSSGAGRRVERMVGHIDLWPTLAEFAGVPEREGLDGESFLPLLLDPEADLEPRMRFIEYMGMVGVRTERWKYIRMRGLEPLLFDLHADPNELVNCIAEHPEVAAQLAGAVEFADEERSKGKAERVVLDAESVEALHALGYL